MIRIAARSIQPRMSTQRANLSSGNNC